MKVIVSVSSINFEMNSFLSIDENGKHITVYDFTQEQSIPVKSYTFDKVLLQSAVLVNKIDSQQKSGSVIELLC